MDALSMEQFWGLLLALGSAAILYSSSGHGGATAYLALFGLWGLAPAQMKPLALLMNVVVAGTGAVRFLKAGAVPGRTVGLLLLGSVPCAFLGALVTLPAPTYRGLLGLCLLFAALRLWWRPSTQNAQRVWPPQVVVVTGAGLGFLSGVTGIGGGIFLSPVLVLSRIETPRQTAAAAAVFIVVNSVAGLLAQAHIDGLAQLPTAVPTIVVVGVVFGGGLVGSFFAAHRLAAVPLKRVLGIVLVISGLKLLSEAVDSVAAAPDEGVAQAAGPAPR